MYKLQPGNSPGVDALPTEFYCRLSLNLKRHLAARLWDIAIGKIDEPPNWANLVRPLYKKGDWANLDNWRTIACRIQTHMDAHPQTDGPGSVPGCTAHNVGSHTR